MCDEAALYVAVLVMFLLSRWSGGLVARFGAKRPLIIGPLIAALGFALFALPGIGGSYWTTFFPAVLVLSLGMATSVAPLTTTVMGAVDARHAGTASGINNAVSRVAGLLAIAVLGVLLIKTFNTQLDRRLDAIEIPPEARQQVQQQRVELAAIAVPETLNPEQRAAVQHAIQESFVAAFRLVMLLAAGLAAASALVARRMIDGEEVAQRAGSTPTVRQQRTKQQDW